MGYVHDTHFTQVVPPSLVTKTAGTWTPSITSNVHQEARTAADAAFTLIVPVMVPSNASALKGCQLNSIDLFYKIATAAADDVATVELEKISQVSGAQVSGAAVTTTLDSGHDTAAKRKAAGDHCLTVTLASPAWIDDNDYYALQVVVDCAATTVFTLYGAHINYTFRA